MPVKFDFDVCLIFSDPQLEIDVDQANIEFIERSEVSWALDKLSLAFIKDNPRLIVN